MGTSVNLAYEKERSVTSRHHGSKIFGCQKYLSWQRQQFALSNDCRNVSATVLFLSASMNGKVVVVLPFSFYFLLPYLPDIICWDPEVVLPWQRDVTPFPLYCTGSRPPSRVQRAYMQPNLVLFRVITFTAVSCLQLVAIMMKVVHALLLVATDHSRKHGTE